MTAERKPTPIRLSDDDLRTRQSARRVAQLLEQEATRCGDLPIADLWVDLAAEIRATRLSATTIPLEARPVL